MEIKKKIQGKSAEVKPEVKEKKVLHPVKKEANTTMAEKQADAINQLKEKGMLDPKAEAAAPAVPAAPAPAVEEKKRPEMPDKFCMTKADWDGNGKCYDPESSNCTKNCGADPECAETFAACKARAEFLGSSGKVAKSKKSGAAKVRANKNGQKPQSIVIDDLLKANTPMATMIETLAKAAFGGESEAAKNAADNRIQSHLKAIRTGTYCRAEAMKPFTVYLAESTPKPAAAAAPAAS